MLYLTRHGETLWNTKKILQGRGDSPLTDRGISELRLLGEEIRDMDLDRLYSSPLKRALDSAKILNVNDKEIVIDGDLSEMGYGPWEGLGREILERDYGENFYNYLNRPELYLPVGEGESFECLYRRVCSVLERIRRPALEGDILVVSHGVVIRMIYLVLEGGEIKDLWKTPYVANGKLIRIDLRNY